MRFIDLTHTFTADMPVYPGDPPPEISQFASIEKDGYVDHKITMAMHVGTHMDAPLHMLVEGKRLSQIPIPRFTGRGVFIDARGKTVADDELLKGVSLQEGDIVIVMTGFYKKYREPAYFEAYPEVSEKFAQKLIDSKVSILGVDTPSPDREPFPVHKLLFKQNILIIENLTNLEALMGIPEFEVIAFPAKFDIEAAPVRVVAKVLTSEEKRVH